MIDIDIETEDAWGNQTRNTDAMETTIQDFQNR